MKAHELGEYLLKCPDLAVTINGWGSDEGDVFEVGGAVLTGTNRLELCYYHDDGSWWSREERIEV